MNRDGCGAGRTPRIEPFGDAAILVTLGDQIDVDLNARVHMLAGMVERLRERDRRFHRPIPAYASLLVPFDPTELTLDTAATVLEPLAAEVISVELVGGLDRPVVDIRVHYGGPSGPDLEQVAATLDLRPADVVEIHSGATYRVFMLGFAPGFAYLGPLPPALATPRLATPRLRVPAGSVAIADNQTAIYPFATPGGWRLIGRTDEWLWNVDRSPPTRFVPGDRVRFISVP